MMCKDVDSNRATKHYYIFPDEHAMRPTNILIISIRCILLSLICSGPKAQTLIFTPEQMVSVKIQAEGSVVKASTRQQKEFHTQEFHLETQKPLKLIEADYNFDHYSDFSASHIDDGIGTYTIYQIYIYCPKTKRFEPLHPKCGDDFINLSVRPKERQLIYSYFKDNELKLCALRNR